MASEIKTRLVQITDPSADVISLSEARAQVRLIPYGSPEAHDDDALLTRMVNAAVEEVDGVDGWLGRALINRNLEYRLESFPYDDERLLLPLTSAKPSGSSTPIVSFKYTDTNGVEQTLVEGTDFIVELANDVQYVEPVYGKTWPSVRSGTGAVTIKYTAGYGSSSADIPEPIRNYIFYRLGQFYEFRELFVSGTIIAEVPYIRESINRYRNTRNF